MTLLEKFRDNQKYVAWGFFIVGFSFWFAFLIMSLKNANYLLSDNIAARLIILWLVMIVCGYMVECNRCKYLLDTKQSF